MGTRQTVKRKRKYDESFQTIITSPATEESWSDSYDTKTNKRTRQAVKRKRKYDEAPLYMIPPSSPERCTEYQDTNNNTLPGILEIAQKTRPAKLSEGSNCISKKALNELWCSKRTDEVLTECEKICSFIMKKSDYIVHIYPAYDSKDKHRVQFVVLTEKKIRLPRYMYIKYDLVIRNIEDCSGESSDIMRNKQITRKKYRLNQTNAKRIRKAINKNAPELLLRHKYLSVISGSGFRSKNYGNEKREFKAEPCIVMYVHTKGKIPLLEREIPKKINGIPVDIREGNFQTSVLAADKFQKKLCHGCQISSAETAEDGGGTLGGFIEHPEFGLCGITCAHVLLNEKQLHTHRQKHRQWKVAKKNRVYQPANIRYNNAIGCLRETFYNSGSNGKPGVDLAVFQVQNRAPDCGKYPESAEIKQYDSGLVAGESQLNIQNQRVVKYGRTTGTTRGILEFNGAAVKMVEHTLKYKVNGNTYTYTLFDQLEIRPNVGEDFFSDLGDSGALVFTENVSKEPACIGMIVGHIDVKGANTRKGNTIVTPASAIQDELGIHEFKSFIWNTIDNMKEKFNSIDRHLENITKRLDDISKRI